MASDGIRNLVQVQQHKAESASSDLQEIADKQQGNVQKQQTLRGMQNTFESLVKDASLSGATNAIAKPNQNLNSSAIASEAFVTKPESYLTRFSKSGFETSSPFSAAGLAKNLVDVGSSPTRYANGLNAFVDAFKKRFEESTNGLEGQDRLGNFSIQNLMSAYNEAQTLAHSVKKKTDDQGSVVGKIG